MKCSLQSERAITQTLPVLECPQSLLRCPYSTDAPTCCGPACSSGSWLRDTCCRAAFSTWMAFSTAEASSSRSSAAYALRVADKGLSLRLPDPAERWRCSLACVLRKQLENSLDTIEGHAFKNVKVLRDGGSLKNCSRLILPRQMQ